MAQETGSECITNSPFVTKKDKETLYCQSRLAANAKIPSPFKVSIHQFSPFFSSILRNVCFLHNFALGLSRINRLKLTKLLEKCVLQITPTVIHVIRELVHLPVIYGELSDMLGYGL